MIVEKHNDNSPATNQLSSPKRESDTKIETNFCCNANINTEKGEHSSSFEEHSVVNHSAIFLDKSLEVVDSDKSSK